VDLVEPGSNPLEYDVAADLAEFVSHFPAWVHQTGAEQGYPLSWRHFMVGRMSLLREHARAQLREATAVGVQNMKEETAREWLESTRNVANWRR
jgi:hypothetical protein